MEILDNTYMEAVLNVGLVMSGMSIALIMITMVAHWLAERRQQHTLAFDRVNEPIVMNYLIGKTPQISVISAMGQEPSEAMNLLMELSRKLQPSAQSRLLPLFTGFSAVEKEITELDSPHAKRRIQAAERLAFLKNETSAEALVHALEDEAVAVRYGAARSLAAHGRPEFIEPTLLAFDLEHEINWFRLVEIISDYGPVAAPTLLTILEDPQWRESSSILNVVIRALGLLEELQAVGPLIELLHHPDLSVRLNAARALGDIGDPAAILPISALSHDPDAAMRKKAVDAMGRLQAETQIPVLEEALADESWWVRFSAAEALYSLGETGIRKLRDIRKNTHDVYVHDICSQILSEHELHNQKGNPS